MLRTEVGLFHLVLQTRERGGTGSILGRIQGPPLHPELEYGVMAETIGVIGVRIPRSDLIDALGEEVSQTMVDIGRMAFITDRRCKALGQPHLTIHTSEQQRPTI